MALPLAALGIAAGGQLIGGYLQGQAQEDAARAAAAEKRRREMQAQSYYADAYKNLFPYYRSIVDQLPPEQQIQAIQQWSPITMEDYGVFDPSSETQRFLDPSMDYQLAKAREATLAGQAASGMMMSGAAQRELAEESRKMAETGYGTAQQNAYTDYLQRFNAARQANADRLNQSKSLLDISGNAQGNLSQLGQWQAQGFANSLADTSREQGYLAGSGKNMRGQAVSGLLSPGNVGAFAQGGGFEAVGGGLSSLGNFIGDNAGINRWSGSFFDEYGYPFRNDLSPQTSEGYLSGRLPNYNTTGRAAGVVDRPTAGTAGYGYDYNQMSNPSAPTFGTSYFMNQQPTYINRQAGV